MGEDTSNHKKTHSELVAASSAVAPDGTVWFLCDGKTPELSFVPGSVNPELSRLLASAHILYRVASDTRDMMEHLVRYLELKGFEEAVPSIALHQSAINIAMKCATEGIENVLDRLKSD